MKMAKELGSGDVRQKPSGPPQTPKGVQPDQGRPSIEDKMIQNNEQRYIYTDMYKKE